MAAQTINIKITSPGVCSGPCDLYADADGYTTAFATGISITVLSSLVGYNTTAVPAGSTTIRIQNNNANCSNFVDVPIVT